MGVTGSEHRRVHQEARRAGNATARARRSAPVQLIRCLDRGGVVLVALSRRTPRLGYVLSPGPDERLTCPCAGYTWRGECQHVAAAMGAPPANPEL